MSTFKIGSFNIVPTIGIMVVLCVPGSSAEGAAAAAQTAPRGLGGAEQREADGPGPTTHVCCITSPYLLLTCRLAGIGAAPYGVRRLITGEVSAAARWRVGAAMRQRPIAPLARVLHRPPSCLLCGRDGGSGDSSVLTRTATLGCPSPLPAAQWPTIKDAYEEYAIWRKEVWDVGAPHSRTRDYTYDVAKVEAGWREAHAKAGNPVVAPQVSERAMRGW